MSHFDTFNNIAFVVIMMIGLYTLISRQNLVKKTLVSVSSRPVSS